MAWGPEAACHANLLLRVGDELINEMMCQRARGLLRFWRRLRYCRRLRRLELEPRLGGNAYKLVVAQFNCLTKLANIRGAERGRLAVGAVHERDAGAHPPVDITQSAFDASEAVCLRSPLSTLPAGIKSRRFRNAHHHGFWPQQPAVAWDQRPDRRTRRALRHLSYSYVPPFGPAMLVTQDPKADIHACSRMSALGTAMGTLSSTEAAA